MNAKRAALAVWLLAGSAAAYRPFDSTDASVAAPGALELEIGPVGFYRQAARSFLSLPTLIINLNIWERVELVAQTRHLLLLSDTTEPRSRLDNTGFFLKAVLRRKSLQ